MLVAVLVVLTVFAGALTRATFGFGEAVVAMPVLALLPLSLHTAASLMGLAGLTVALLSTAGRSRQIDAAALVRLAAGTVLGLPLGLALMLYVPTAVTEVVLGGLLIVYGLYGLLPAPSPGRPGLRWAYPVGVLAGALGSAFNFNGVPVAVYGTLRRWRPAVFRGTLQAHFVISGALVVTAQAVGGMWTGRLPGLFAVSLPAIGLATWGGHRLHRRIPAARFVRYVYVLVAALGAALVLRAATGG